MKTDYERGFDAGERKAWKDRGKYIRGIRPAVITSERLRGFWDGYEPRSLAWAMRPKAECHWNDKEAA